MKNYYEILEVNQKASKEIIEKAYKVLAKKYHPDLRSGQAKIEANKKLKDINEAYDVLSNEFLREQYDIELQKKVTQNIRSSNYNRKSSQHEKNEVKRVNNKENEYKLGSFASIIGIVKELYKNRPKKHEHKEITKIDVISVVLTIIVVILIGVILWFIPFTNGWMRELLFENPLFNWIGRLFS